MSKHFPFEVVRRWRALGRDERAFVVASLLAAPAVTASLDLLGFSRTIRWVQRVPRLGSARLRALDNTRAGTIVERAFQAHPLCRSGCLPQAILQYSLLRLAGRDVTLRVGVRPGSPRSPTLDAHAWVDEPESEADLPYEVLFEVPPR